MSIQWASSQSCPVKWLPHIYVNTTYSAKCKFSVRKLCKNMLGEIKSATIKKGITTQVKDGCCCQQYLIFTQLDYVFVAKCKFSVCQHATAKSSHSTSLQSGRLSCLGNAFLSCLNLPCPVWPETHYGPPSASDEQNPDSHLLAPSVSPLGQGKSLGRPSCVFSMWIQIFCTKDMACLHYACWNR